MAAPSRFCHVVYKTHRYNGMIEWYLKVFQARIQHRDDRLCFLTYDDEHHRMAFLNLGPGQECIGSAHSSWCAARCVCVEGRWRAYRHVQAFEELWHTADPTSPTRPHLVSLL